MTAPAPRFRIRRRAVSALEALFAGTHRYTVQQHVRKTIFNTGGWTDVTSTRTLRGAHRVVARHRRAGVVWEDPPSWPAADDSADDSASAAGGGA